MPVRLCKTLWGVDVASPSGWKTAVSRMAEDGFSAVETPLFVLDKFIKRDVLLPVLREARMDYVAQVHTCTYNMDNGAVPTADVQAHLDSFSSELASAEDAGAVHVNVHAGHDSWDAATTAAFLDAATALVPSNLKDRVSFETHRRRVLWNPFVAREALARCNDKVRLTADLSHWVVACERLFEEKDDPWWPALLAEVGKRCALIHARVASPSAIQVADPADPQCATETAAFESWWKQLYTSAPSPPLVEPEYGPPPYAPVLPYTAQPTVELWDVTRRAADRLRVVLG